MAQFDFITLAPKSSIGGIEIQASLEEILTDVLQLTEHPVEVGAAITDHAYKSPAEVVLRCAWSNSSPDALSGAIQAIFNGGGLTGSDYVSGVYSQLLALQQSREPFDIMTTSRMYTDMQIVSLQKTVDNKTSNTLMVQATCRQIIRVFTQSTTLPVRANQANPKETASIENAGVKQTVPGTPSPGGAVAPENM